MANKQTKNVTKTTIPEETVNEMTFYTNRFNDKIYLVTNCVKQTDGIILLELTPVASATGSKVWINQNKPGNFYQSKYLKKTDVAELKTKNEK